MSTKAARRERKRGIFRSANTRELHRLMKLSRVQEQRWPTWELVPVWERADHGPFCIGGRHEGMDCYAARKVRL